MKNLFLLLFFVPLTQGCSCVEPDRVLNEILCQSSKSYVLRGTVESVSETGGNDTSKGAKFYSVKIEKIFRGKQALLNATGQASIPTGSSIYLQTQRQSGACGANFQLNTDYVITGYVNPGEKFASTSSCGWNKPWSSLTSEDRTRIENYGDGICSAGTSLLLSRMHILLWSVLFVGTFIWLSEQY